MKKFIISLGVTAVIGVLLLVKMPDQVSMPRVMNGDKYIHAFLFLILSWVVYHDARRAQLKQWLVYLLAALWPMLWGGVLELIQGYCLSYRSGSWWDWVADLIGIAMGVSLCRVWQKDVS